MTDVDRLFTEFKQQYRDAGSADPRRFLEQLDGVDRRELEVLLKGFLERAPRRRWDPDAYAQSPASVLVDRLDRSLHGQSGRWPSVLPALRDKAKLRRTDLVKRLATALGVEGREKKVEAYYHEMEQGLLPASGVSARVLEALGEIFGAPAEALRRAGESPRGPASEQTDAVVFARVAPAPSAEITPHSPGRPSEEQWDEVDQLFRGG